MSTICPRCVLTPQTVHDVSSLLRLSTMCHHSSACPRCVITPQTVHDVSSLVSLSTMCPQTVHDVSSDCPWYVIRLSMTCPQTVHDVSSDCPWCVIRLSMKCPQTISTICIPLWRWMKLPYPVCTLSYGINPWEGKNNGNKLIPPPMCPARVS
jgi:hypothetical protein